MSITIANLKYQDTDSSIIRYMRSNYDWLSSVSVINNVKGKGSVNDIDIEGDLLKSASCASSDVNTSLLAKEVELNYYNLSFPVSHCDLRQTWLSAFATKYANEEDVYIHNLIPFLADKVNSEIRDKFNDDIVNEAITDSNVAKVSLLGNISTPSDAYSTVLEFVQKLPLEFVNEALDRYSNEWFTIQVSPEVYRLASLYLSDRVSSYGLNIGGFSVSANKSLSGDRMVAKSYKNDLLLIDDTDDLGAVKVVRKEWLNTSYIVTGVAFKGSYIDSKRIVISN